MIRIHQIHGEFYVFSFSRVDHVGVCYLQNLMPTLEEAIDFAKYFPTYVDKSGWRKVSSKEDWRRVPPAP